MSTTGSEIFRQRREDVRDELKSALEIRGFGLDTVNYAWVEGYLADQKARNEIKSLEREIRKVREAPIDPGELRAAFEANMQGLKARKLELLKSHIADAQQQRVQLLSPESVFAVIGAPYGYLSFLDYVFSPEDLDFLFRDLGPGVPQQEKDKQFSTCQKRIEFLEKQIVEVLSPQERWFHTPAAKPIPYPKGCRWTHFVSTWKETASRYREPVTIDGLKLSTEREHWAYHALELDKVVKVEPLSEGARR